MTIIIIIGQWPSGISNPGSDWQTQPRQLVLIGDGLTQTVRLTQLKDQLRPSDPGPRPNDPAQWAQAQWPVLTG